MRRRKTVLIHRYAVHDEGYLEPQIPIGIAIEQCDVATGLGSIAGAECLDIACESVEGGPDIVGVMVELVASVLGHSLD